jgi:hypothetical protein
MNLDHLTPKQLNEIEHLVRELTTVLRKAHLQNEPISKTIQELEIQIGAERRARYDAANPEYSGY